MPKDMIPQDMLESKILLLRGHKVMLDRDLAMLYGVDTKALNQAVARNAARFPDDFMFRLEPQELTTFLRSQFVTLKKGRGRHSKYLPYAFTENGVAMLSSVLKSERAISVNIQIMRTFSRLREMLAANRELSRRVDELEKKYDARFKSVFDAIKALMSVPEGPEPKRISGFKP